MEGGCILDSSYLLPVSIWNTYMMDGAPAAFLELEDEYNLQRLRKQRLIEESQSLMTSQNLFQTCAAFSGFM